MADNLDFMGEVIKLIENICKKKGISVKVQPDTRIFDEKLLDSVTFAQFMVALETEMDIDVPDHKLSVEYFVTPRTIYENFAADALSST